jgi:hypothetical protein
MRIVELCAEFLQFPHERFVDDVRLERQVEKVPAVAITRQYTRTWTPPLGEVLQDPVRASSIQQRQGRTTAPRSDNGFQNHDRERLGRTLQNIDSLVVS